MPERKRTRAAPSGPYRHVIGGEVDGKRHEPGDRVSASTPSQKLAEWLQAGVIEPDKRSQKRSKEDESERERND